MTKRILAALLALVMALCLCACDSSDYKKALNLYDAGDYEQARAIFEALADYEDSAEMVNRCDYQMALEHMEAGEYEEAKALFVKLDKFEDSAEKLTQCNYKIALAELETGEYQQARELFVALGDYEDSAANAVTAAQHMLIDHVKSKGQLVKKSDDNSEATILEVDGDQMVAAYIYKVTGIINIDLRIGTLLKPGSQQLVLAGTDTLSTYAAYYTASASCTWDIENYKQDTKMAWEDFEVSGKTAQGTVYPQDTTWLNMFLTSGVKDIAGHIAQVLEESGLGLTMKDIGFTNY